MKIPLKCTPVALSDIPKSWDSVKCGEERLSIRPTIRDFLCGEHPAVRVEIPEGVPMHTVLTSLRCARITLGVEDQMKVVLRSGNVYMLKTSALKLADIDC